MIKSIIKYALFFVVTIILTFEVYFHYKYDNNQKLVEKSLAEKLYGINQLNAQLMQNIISTFSNNGRKIKGYNIAYDLENSSIKPMNEYLSLPCLVIYIPYSPETCMSCVDFAINKVKFHFSDFEKNPNLCIISSISHPGLVNRVYHKNIYHLINNGEGFGIPADKEHNPHYFIVNKNNEINSFFTPNIFYPELVDKYLANVEKLITNNTSCELNNFE